MKNSLLFIFTLLICYNAEAQPNTWVKTVDWPGLKRTRAVGIAIDQYGYAGTGVDTAEVVFNDWWRFDPTDSSWTQMMDVPGPVRRNAIAWVISGFGYVGTGIDNNISDLGTKLNDMYKYDPGANSWSPIAACPLGGGAGVYQATGFAIDNSGFIACGKLGPDWYSQELWEYNAPSNLWFARPNFPGGDRQQLSSFAVEGKGYVGMGTDHDLYRKDWWQYDPSSMSWVEVAELPGTERSSATTFVIESRGFVVFGSDGGVLKELWEYNPFSDSWNIKASYGGSARKYGVAFTIGDTAWAGLGQGLSGKKMSWYKYIPAGPLDLWEEEPFNMTVYPNPISEHSLVSLPHAIQDGAIVIHDMSGRIVHSDYFSTNNIPLGNLGLKSGTFVLSIIGEDKELLGSTKITVQ